MIFRQIFFFVFGCFFVFFRVIFCIPRETVCVVSVTFRFILHLFAQLVFSCDFLHSDLKINKLAGPGPGCSSLHTGFFCRATTSRLNKAKGVCVIIIIIVMMMIIRAGTSGWAVAHEARWYRSDLSRGMWAPGPSTAQAASIWNHHTQNPERELPPGHTATTQTLKPTRRQPAFPPQIKPNEAASTNFAEQIMWCNT